MKIVEEQNKVLKEKYERYIIESMINNVQLNGNIIGLRLKKMMLEQERAQLYDKVKILENQEKKENSRKK